MSTDRTPTQRARDIRRDEQRQARKTAARTGLNYQAALEQVRAERENPDRSLAELGIDSLFAELARIAPNVDDHYHCYAMRAALETDAGRVMRQRFIGNRLTAVGLVWDGSEPFTYTPTSPEAEPVERILVGRLIDALEDAISPAERGKHDAYPWDVDEARIFGQPRVLPISAMSALDVTNVGRRVAMGSVVEGTGMKRAVSKRLLCDRDLQVSATEFVWAVTKGDETGLIGVRSVMLTRLTDDGLMILESTMVPGEQTRASIPDGLSAREAVRAALADRWERDGDPASDGFGMNVHDALNVSSLPLRDQVTFTRHWEGIVAAAHERAARRWAPWLLKN